jgi:uncharacterized protein (DUF2141 family)
MRCRPVKSAILALLAAIGMSALPAAAQQPTTIEVQIANLHNAAGKVWICLWKEGETEGFPRCDKSKPLAKLSAPAGAPTVVFPGVKPGTYAISMFHDEKETGVPETNMVGLPKSGIGMSNNPAVGVTSPPSFDKARFTVGADVVRHTIEARYLF